MDLHSASYSDTDRNLKEAVLRERRIPRLSKFEDLLRAFSPSERLALYILTAMLSMSALALLAGLNAAVSVRVPSHGGSYIEGQVGSARFINPILTLSQADESLSQLVYSGLMRARPDGTYIPDIASSYEISEEGTLYTFHLKDGVTFHDGKPLTSADVVFTIELAQNPEIRSSRRADWEGVHVAAPDEHTVTFKLPRPYAPFIENATLGILPQHLWQSVTPEEFPFSPLNTHPVGTGPYRVLGFESDSTTGSATRYDLTAFENFTLKRPYLKRISFVFYPNSDAMIQALNDKKIDGVAGVAPSELETIERDVSVVTAPLPRVFGVFFNQNHSTVLSDATVRAALEEAVDAEAITRSVLSGYGAVLHGPIPPGVVGKLDAAHSEPLTHRAIASTTPDSAHADAAKATLAAGGWKFDENAGMWTKKDLQLSFVLSTANEPQLVATANALAAYWRAAGVHVEVSVYSLSELNATVIRPRSYDAVLFGEVVGRTGDFFAFWHSSQRNDPGLNLAMYANTKADSLLSEARTSTDANERERLYESFSDIIAKDDPAIFLYAPDFIYVVPSNLLGIELGALTTPAERFLNVYQWYTQTERVWEIFANR